jgi:transposase
MKAKLTLSIDAGLMEEINRRARLNKRINLSKMVEAFLQSQFTETKQTNNAVISKMRGILKETQETLNWKDERIARIRKKHLS